jgi:hypothetical protein
VPRIFFRTGTAAALASIVLGVPSDRPSTAAGPPHRRATMRHCPYIAHRLMHFSSMHPC